MKPGVVLFLWILIIALCGIPLWPIDVMEKSQPFGFLLLCATLLICYAPFLPRMGRFAARHPLQVAILIVFYGFIFAQLGVSLGIPALFWHEHELTRIVAAASSTLFLGLMFTNVYYIDPVRDRSVTILYHYFVHRKDPADPYRDLLARWRWAGLPARMLPRWYCQWLLTPSEKPVSSRGNVEKLRVFISIMGLPFVMLLLAPAVFPLVFSGVPRSVPEGLIRALASIKPGQPVPPSLLDPTVDPIAWCVGILLWSFGIALGILAIGFMSWVSMLAAPQGSSRLFPLARSRRDEARGRFDDARAASKAAWGLLGLAQVGRAHPERIQLLSFYRDEAEDALEAARFDLNQHEAYLSISTFFVWVIGFYVLISLIYFWVPAALAICAVLGVISLLTAPIPGLHTSRPTRRWGITLAAIAILCLFNASSFKLHIPNLDAHYPRSLYGCAELVQLPKVVERYKDRKNPDVAAHCENPVELVCSKAALENWRDRLRDKGIPKPKLVVLAVSGGGIRAAKWTAIVIDAIDREFRRLGDEKKAKTPTSFRDHVRLITGASGGMLGAAYFVAKAYLDLRPPVKPPPAPFPNFVPAMPAGPNGVVERADAGNFVNAIQEDSLSETVSHMVLRDPFYAMLPVVAWNDRGRVIERIWEKKRKGSDINLDIKIPELSQFERSGEIPSLVFSPMLVEDGRRLLISNLDLNFLVRSEGRMLWDEDKDPGEKHPYSISSLEFYRLFPCARDFRLSTAVRLSATFPWVTPAVSLPTNPPRRVVDAGYYDNYGVQLAASWIFEHRETIMADTSGVVLIQIRDFLGQDDRLAIHSKSPGFWDLVSRGFEFPMTPIQGLLASKYSSSSFRNDREIEGLSRIFDEKMEEGFFTTITFENGDEVALSWYITQAEITKLTNGMKATEAAPPPNLTPREQERWDNRFKNEKRLGKLVEWWNHPFEKKK